jgi:hypothetical protein
MVTAIADPAIEAAEQALVEAEAAEAVASAAVSAAREALALAPGKTATRALFRARNENARRSEATEQARARIRAVTKAAAAAGEIERSVREAERVTRARQLAAEREAIEATIRQFFAATQAGAAVIDKQAKEWNDEAAGARREGGGFQPGHLAVPSDAGRAWGSFLGGLSELRRLWTR